MPFDGARIMYNTRICIKPILGKFAHFCLKKSVLAYKFMHLPSVAAGGPNRKIHQKLNLSHHQTYRVYRDRVTYLIHSSYIRLRYRKNMPLKEVASHTVILPIPAASADKKCGFFNQNMATKWTFTGRILPILAPLKS